MAVAVQFLSVLELQSRLFPALEPEAGERDAADGCEEEATVRGQVRSRRDLENMAYKLSVV